MSRQSGRNGLAALPAIRYDDGAAALSPRDVVVAQLEDRLAQQERTTRSLIDHAFRVKDDVIASLGTARGSWQSEAQARELLQEHIRAITDVVRKLSRDIQFLEAQIKERDGATIGTQHVVKNLELHHVAGVTDLRSRVVRCDASIARLAADLKTAYESIQAVGQRQQEQNAQIIEKLHHLDTKIQTVTSALDRINAEHSLQLHHIESGAASQLTGLDVKTRSWAEELKVTINAARAAEQAEREKLEAKFNAQMERALVFREAQLEKMHMKRDEVAAEVDRSVSRLQDELLKERERITNIQRVIDTRMNNSLDSTVHRQAEEVSRLKREVRDGFETIRQSIEEVKEIVEARRQLMEQQLKKEMSQIRKMIVLV